MTHDPLLAGGEFHKHGYWCCNGYARVPPPSISRLNGERRRRGEGREEEEKKEELKEVAEVFGYKSIPSKTRVVYTDYRSIEDALMDSMDLMLNLMAVGICMLSTGQDVD